MPEVSNKTRGAPWRKPEKNDKDQKQPSMASPDSRTDKLAPDGFKVESSKIIRYKNQVSLGKKPKTALDYQVHAAVYPPNEDEIFSQWNKYS